MAKKITIEGSDILSALTEAWGGVNNTGATVTVHGTEVPAGAEWGINRGEIERFIKEQFGLKAGVFRWYKPNDSNYYSLVVFAKAADATAWDADHSLTNYIQTIQLPISTIATDSYICRLAADKSTSNAYVVKNGDSFGVNLRYQSVFVEGATSTSSNYSADGVITIERSVNAGSSWVQVARLGGQTSLDPSAETFPIAIDLGEYLVASMNNRFRIRASYQYTSEGVTKTSYSSYVTFNVSSVNLALSMATDWAVPITANASTSQMALNFTLYGAVQKYLTIKVDGTTFIDATPYDASVNSEQTGNIAITDSTKAIFTHGVHEVQAFLTCSNGSGGTLTSDIMVYHLMVVNSSTTGADLTQPHLLLQEIATLVDNFVQSRICKYAVYHPDGDDIDLSLIICSSAQNYITNPSTEYFRAEKTAESGEQYNLDATLEIEDQAGNTLNSYLQVLRHDGGTTTNFLYETTGVAYQSIPVDNTAGYAPTAGTTFYLNPKLRNNSEANPERILNAANANAEVTSTWEHFKLGQQDGWLLDSEGNKMLRVPAGCNLGISLNPFAQFLSTPNSGMTMDFDIKVSNVTNEDDPILRICEASGQNFIGLRLKPMRGTMTTASHTTESTSDFSWQEDERTHISINIHNAVAPNSANDGLTSDGTTPTGTLALVRVLINGVINREFVFSTTSATEFCTAALSNGGIIIGQEGADIDIYGIRIWASQQLSARNVVQNYIATIPSAAEKERVKKENDIIESGVVNAEKVKALGKNVLIWHGAEIWHGASSTQNGWWEFYQYDADGQLIPELSGTIGKATASLPSKGQGTTAKTYYYWNIQTKISDLTTLINVPIADLHSSITLTMLTSEQLAAYKAANEGAADWEAAAYLKGGNLGKNFPLASESAQVYEVAEIDGVNNVKVPDGWIDGNGKYRGVGYTIVNGAPLAQKLVLKINYASSMQSHIIGVNKLYNDLHRAYCGANALQASTPGAVVAKHLEPFLFFTQASDNAAPVYRGPGAWGPGKMDKPTWGYVKSAFPNFAMFEGADNNKELTDMRVPFDNTVHGGDTYPKVYYHPENECYMYRVDSGLQHSQKCIDFDGGKTTDVSQTDATHLYTGEYPHENLENYLKAAWNFLFLHNPRIKPFITSGGTLGSFSDFASSDAAQDTGNKYWCSDYKLYRYDFADGAWVNAGLWNGTSYDEVNLLDSSAESGTLAYATYTAWNALTSNQKADYEGYVNKAFISGIVSHAKANIGNYFVVNSLKFHYAFENHFIAGTDNCSKNTYYVLVPTGGSMGAWTDWKFELHQDDVDTVLATDNSGLQTKPYYIDRMHPYAEDDVNETDSLYEGTNNVLFNLCEEMWEDSLEISDTLRSILSSMSGLTGGTGSAVSDGMNGVWKALNRYIFDVQRYIPAMAFNEAARIRYEFPKLMNYTSDQRQVDPIEQSMGDQLQAELQWMKRRLVYMASYAAFGEFAPATTVNTGISDLSQSFAMVMAALPNSTTQTSQYTFRLVPHQWIYPTAAMAQSSINPHVRVAPGAANMPNGYFEIVLSPTARSDDGITIYGINYYRSIGNIGNNCFNPAGTLTLNGKRLTEFKAEPSTYYSTTVGGNSITAEAWRQLSDADKANYLPAFRCSGVNVGSATRIADLSFNGCSSVGGNTIDIGGLSRAASIDLRYTDILSVALPQTPTLTTLKLPAKLTTLSIMNCGSLETVSVQGFTSMTSMTVKGCPLLSTATRALVLSLHDGGAAVTNIEIDNINWQAQTIDGETMRWLLDVGDAGSCKLSGRIEMASTSATPSGRLYYDDVARLIRRYGNIYDSTIAVTDNALYVNFATTAVTAAMLAIEGRKYINPSELTDKTIVNGNVTGGYYNDLQLLVNGTGNNVAAVQKSDGTWTPNVKWTIETTGMSSYAAIEDIYSPVIHVILVSQVTMVVRATLTDINGNERYVEKTIGLWRRVPQVGDFAWTDGEFDNEDDTSKALAGLVVMRQMYTSDNQLTTDSAQAAWYKIWVYSFCGGTNASANNVTMLSSSDGQSSQYGDVSTQCWGMYPVTGGSSVGLDDTKSNSVYVDGLLAAIATATGRSDVFDTPLSNLSGDAYLRKDAAAVAAAGGGIAMQDDTQPDGWAVQTASYMTNFDSEGERDKLMAYADTVLQAVLDYMNISDDDLPDDCKDSLGNTHPQTPQALADLTQMLVQYAADNGVSNPARYREFMFCAARLCDVWCPADVSANIINGTRITEAQLDDQYKRGKWMLPSSALLARIFNFLGNSRSGYNTSAAPSSSYANNNVVEAKLALFANAIAKGRTVPVSYSSSQWSGTETYRYSARYVYFGNGYASNYGKYNGIVVRPVAAFKFVP